VGVGLGVVVGVADGVTVAVAVGVGVTLGIGVPVGVAVGVGVGPEGVMLKAPLVEELFWKRMSLATTRTRTSGMPVDGGSCQA
jgi:zinc transporter ZupT